MRSLISARLGRVVRVEAKVLGDASSDKYRLEDGTSVVPWDLRLFLVPIWAGGDTQNGLTRYYGLAREARMEGERAKQPSSVEHETAADDDVYKPKEVWDSRLRELGLYIGSTLMGMRDSITAIDHFRGLYSTARKVGGDANIEFSYRAATSLAFVYLIIGDTISAREWFQLAPTEYSKELALATCSLADGDMAESASLIEKYCTSTDKHDTEALNNLAVSNLHEGNLTKAIELLEKVVREGGINSTVLFNLFILYDLQHETPGEKKRQIGEQIRSQGVESLGTYELFLHR